MKNSIILNLIFLILISSQPAASQSERVSSVLPWSERMAQTVMERYPELTDMDLIFHQRSKPKWQYDIAMLAQTIYGLGAADSTYEVYMKSYTDFFIDKSGKIFNYNICDYNLDKINPGNNLIILYEATGEEKYRKAIETLIGQLKDQPDNPDGGFWHKARYPYQMWLDGIYMSSPFMARYASVFNKLEWYDEVLRQVKVIRKHTIDPETGLLYHAYDASRGMKWSDDETGCSPHFWGRAMGWYMMALVDALDYFPESHPGRKDIIEIFQQTSEALVRVRDPATGLWYQVLDMGNRQGNYLEASASCMFVYVFAKGANSGYLEQDFKKMAEASFEGILKEFITVGSDGLVDIHNGCFAAGLGGLEYRSGSYEYYINEKKGKNDSKSIGPFIMAAQELNR